MPDADESPRGSAGRHVEPPGVPGFLLTCVGRGGDARRRAGRLALLAALLAVALGAVGVLVAGLRLGGDSASLVLADPARSASPTPPSQRVITVLGAGDLLIHPPVWEQAAADAEEADFDFYPMFAGLEPVISGADLAICHLETPLAPDGGPYQGFPAFSAPPEAATALAQVGYDTCSTASNHTLDQGEAGVTRTIDALEAAGLGWTGSARNAQDAATPYVREVVLADGQAVHLGHLAYTYGFNGLSPPEGKDWIANRIDAEQILEEARAARQAGAEIVVLSMHWGTEYQVDPNQMQLRLGEELADSGEIDLILGHHAHVVQPVEQVGDAWVVYGTGNQLARHADVIDAQREGAMVLVTFTELAAGWEVTAIEVVPTWVAMEPAIRLVDLAAVLAGPGGTTGGQRAAYLAAYERVSETLLRRGAGEDGLVVREPSREP